jgi:hypothetical protein
MITSLEKYQLGFLFQISHDRRYMTLKALVEEQELRENSTPKQQIEVYGYSFPRKRVKREKNIKKSPVIEGNTTPSPERGPRDRADRDAPIRTRGRHDPEGSVTPVPSPRTVWRLAE